MDTKSDLRRAILEKLTAQTAVERLEKSRVIQTKLFAHAAFQKAKKVSFYVSLPAEVDTCSMIDAALAAGKKIFVPKTDLKAKKIALYEIKNRTELRPGILSIPEPDPSKAPSAKAEEMDLVVVPGVVFDRENHRIGHGAGLYDRFLAGLPSATLKVGLGYLIQIVSKIPAERHDVKLDLVITD